MWQTDSLWFEIAVVSIIFSLGHISFGHFEERTPRFRKFLKYLFFVALIISLSVFFGRTTAFTVLGLWFLPVIYVHAVYLPKKGINGWTAEPKAKYYEFRKWDKDIFK